MEKKYKKGQLTVVWKPNLCIHSGKCVHGLPTVFKPKEKPWIQLENDKAENIEEVVLNCPSGALSIERSDSADTSSKPEVQITFVENGPLMIVGRVGLDYLGKKEDPSGVRVALCRCGASSKKPYCDGTHKNIDFKD